MKVNGRKLEAPNAEVLVIPRPQLEDGSSGDVVFTARAITDFAEFELLCPRPSPPLVSPRGGEPFLDTKDKVYREKIMKYVERKTQYTILKSLSESPGLEWETVDLAKPDTWGSYVSELKAAGFSESEMNKIVDLVTSANGMDEEKYKEARNRFLATRGQPGTGSPSPAIGPVSIPNGEAVKDSA